MMDSVIERARLGVEALVCAMRSHTDTASLLEALDAISDVMGLILSAAAHLHELDALPDSERRAYSASLRRLLDETRRIEDVLLLERSRLTRERHSLNAAMEWADTLRRIQ
jgi:hypothetical protein